MKKTLFSVRQDHGVRCRIKKTAIGVRRTITFFCVVILIGHVGVEREHIPSRETDLIASLKFSLLAIGFLTRVLLPLLDFPTFPRQEAFQGDLRLVRAESGTLRLDELFDCDLVVLLILLAVLFQNKARRKRVPVMTLRPSVWTLPEPAVFTEL